MYLLKSLSIALFMIHPEVELLVCFRSLCCSKSQKQLSVNAPSLFLKVDFPRSELEIQQEHSIKSGLRLGKSVLTEAPQVFLFNMATMNIE